MRAFSVCLAILFALLLLGARPAAALEYYWGDGRGVQAHGFGEMQFRTLADGFRGDYWHLSAWTNRFNLELEFDLAPDGWGPFDQVSAFVRAEARIECVYKSVCGLSSSYDLYGDKAKRAPRNFVDATTSGYSVAIPSPDGIEPIHDGRELRPIGDIPPFNGITDLGADQDEIDRVLEPIADALFAARKFNHDNPRGPQSFAHGPWRTGFTIRNIGALSSVESFTDPADPDPTDADPRGGLLLRPKVDRIFSPSHALRERASGFDSFDQNLSENQLFWNHGAGQDEHELKELYFDLELFDHQLWLRLGKQTIVWGKTELFRTTDQLNPTDAALSSLPSLEESRIALWSARAIWSFYSVGPIEDLRLELAVILDDFEPTDLGRCGEPYTIFLLCAKGYGLFVHGFTGFTLAGEERPPNWWDSTKGLEGGARIEFRYDRFSFAISDFYGYSDAPFAERFHGYQRGVDPYTGRPLDALGRPFDTSGIGDPLLHDSDPGVSAKQRKARDALRRQARDYPTGNRQIFDFICGVSVGIAAEIIDNEGVEKACILDVLNNQTDLGAVPGVPFSASNAFSMVFAGNNQGSTIAAVLTGGTFLVDTLDLVTLNVDPNDGPLAADLAGPNAPSCAAFIFQVIAGEPCLSSYLTDEQEALLGCGPFYGNSCDQHGIDVFNAEFSVLTQRAPNLERGMQIATRVVTRNGKRRVLQLPGSRGPGSKRYDPRVDGCITPGADGRAPAGFCAGANPITIDGRLARSEMEALSENFIRLLAALGQAGGLDEECVPDGIPGSPYQNRPNPVDCDLVRAVGGISGMQRPEVSAGRNERFGRRDYLWHGGGEAVLRYNKRNVLGFSMDFAEDRTKTNWSIETTWVNDEVLGNTTTESNVSEADIFNLTLSVDRLTFIRFLNMSRTFFFNSQWFFRWIEGYQGNREITTNGPFSTLGTFSVSTGYFQDRLIPSYTVIHDFMSASGGGIISIAYRYSEVFSVAFGMAYFYGGPRRARVANYPLYPANISPPYLTRTSYQGLSALAERDELFLRLRYTF